MTSSSLSLGSTSPSVDWKRTFSRVLTGHKNSINATAVSGDGKFIASCGDNTILIWESESGTQLQSVGISDECFYGLDISSDGSRVVAGGHNKKVYVWDTHSRVELLRISGHKYWLQSVAFSKDGTRIVSGCEKSVRLWDSTTGQSILVFEDTSSRFYIPLLSEMFTARSVVFSPDGTHVASGGTEKSVKVWNVSNGYCVAVLKGHTDWVTSVAFSPDGQKIFSGSWDDTVRVWDWMSGTCIRVFTNGSGTVYALGVSIDGALAASGSNHDVVVWEVNTGLVQTTLQGHTKSIKGIAFLPNGLVSGSEDKGVRIWKPSMIKADSSSTETPQPNSDSEARALPDTEPQIPATSAEYASEPSASSRTTELRSSTLPTEGPLTKRPVPPPPSTSLFSQSSEMKSPPPLPPRASREPSDLPQRSSTSPSNTGVVFGSSEELVGSPRSSLSISSVSTLVEPHQSVHSGWSQYIPSDRKFTGKYRKTTSEALAYGGFSNVWPCEVVLRDHSVQKVALKELRAVNIPVTMSDSESVLRRMLMRLEREMLVWTTLEHPHIVPLIGFRFQPFMCLISPWYSNGSVKDWIKSHPDTDRRRLMRQVANGLQYLHSLDPPIIHGDIKSDNVMISDEGNAVINDFGLSLVMEAVSGTTNTNSTTGIGNARWLAPEIFCEEGTQRSWASDVYAFGCLILEIMTGAFPYRELSDMKVTLALASGKPPVSDKAIYPELSEDDILWDLMFDCWNPEPEERPSMRVIETRLQG